MATVANGVIGALSVTASKDDKSTQGAGGRVLMIVNRGAGSERLEDEFTGRGWQVRMTGVPAGDLDACIGGITDFLAAPDSPDRAVLLGYGAAGSAAMEVADRHPERVAAVVVVGSPSDGSPASGDSAPDLLCPVLVLSTAAPETVIPALVPFLTDLDRQAGEAGAHLKAPARLPVLTPAIFNDPDALRQWRELGPIHRVNASGMATSWLLTGHEATTTTLAGPGLTGDAEITAGFRLQSADPALAHQGELDLITIEGQEHARLRRLIERHLTPRRVEALRPRIQRETDALLDAIPAHEVIDLLPTFAYPLPVAVLCELFGVPEQDRGYIHEWILERLVSPPPKAHSDIDDYLRALIAARKNRPSDDLLGWVVEAERDGLSEEDLISAARFLMVNGHRAPTTVLASGVAALLRRGQWKRLVDDPTLIVTAVEELLRLITPFPVGIARHVTVPIDVEGTPIPKGDLLSASLVAANRDPSFFTDPDLLDIERASNPHLSFGHGHHHCLGAELARAQTQIAIGTLARRFPDMELARDSQSLHYRQSSVRYLLGLPVVLEPDRPRRPATGV
ncbi:cytochrome P450 [Streptosporangium amethystogenes subsp. fukuiense]|uniref:Cytochrome P450 n=1 Tax=Streptosporangium amethystogenes subsp. fukuiense TaxID=698418 RepID=A0ABW2STY7_9ACTN